MAPIAVSTSPQLQASVPLKKLAPMAEPAFKFDAMEDALAAFARGEFIVVMDDEDRENEGDLIAAASTITTEKMAWFIKHTSGYICISLPSERLEELDIQMMVPNNTEKHKTAYTVTVDYKIGTTTGISAHDRALTARKLVDPQVVPGDFSRPGHMVPLRARPGGVLTRKGHTEAAIDMCNLTNLPAGGLLCELVNDDEQGTMARRDDCRAFADRWGLKMISVEMIAKWRREHGPKNMQFRRLGSSGLRVPVFSLGGWLTFGGTVKGDPLEHPGINMIDLAEGYAQGDSEREIGRVIEELGIRRSDLILTSKIFFGLGRKGPNDRGLSRKHIIEGVNETLERLRTDYVDIVFAHRPDPTVPMEEVVRAFNHVIETGKAFYWGTSEWSARQVEEAHHVASKLNLIAPISEQVQYQYVISSLDEHLYSPGVSAACTVNASNPSTSEYLFDKYNYGTTIWSALASGLLTGKYNDGIPKGSRFDTNPEFFKNTVESLSKEDGQKKIEKVKELTAFAEKELGCSVSNLALAWAASHPHASTVILGATKPEQVIDNLKALEIIKKITPEVREKINKILDNDPTPEPNLRPFGTMVVKNSDVKLEYDPKDMQFRRLGTAGLRVPVFSLGGWLTFGGTVKGDPVKEVVKLAFENGTLINMIDLAESYSKGESEREVGRVIEELGIRRSDLIISSKIFFGQATRKGPNDKGLSRKHVIEGMKEILERLRVDYVDIIFAHRPDPTVPMEEVVRAFNHLIDTGKAFYWGTSEWSARQVEEAYHVAAKLNLIAPIAEQVQYNCFHRQRFESEYQYLYEKYGYGTTIWSPLASGILTGKYNNGIPEGSRFATNADFFKTRIEGLSKEEGLKTLDKASTVILGASNPEQLLENLKALETLKKFTPEVREKINKILDNTPAPEPNLRPL
ncbi:Voltage-gated potassium channel beta-2 subunit [Rhizoctonia solani]|uniref:3,4-dihydroxy-2-butanone 4-phosphate synthase n=1 Tax=Rhizoctonia solani TaxID=456999 RepID=A0A8H7H6H0_9AGAM|nr:Voltage-gated potassium channel beta-2 subunit [Rhizoctonia solani]